MSGNLESLNTIISSFENCIPVLIIRVRQMIFFISQETFTFQSNYNFSIVFLKSNYF